jgi:hypothetical protein
VKGPLVFVPLLAKVYAPVSEALVNAGVVELELPPHPIHRTKTGTMRRVDGQHTRTGYLQLWIIQQLCSLKLDKIG